MKNNNIKLISLNAWCGRTLYPLMSFFRNYQGKADIFCLQEIINSDQRISDERHPEEHICGPLFEKISRELKDFEGSFAYFDDEPNRMSLAVFARRTLPVKNIEDFIVYKPVKAVETGSTLFTARKMQYVTLDINGQDFVVTNFHGLWNGGPKTDTPERIEQSNKVKSFLAKTNGPKILCGDFNLLPDTESMTILEKGMRNLVKEYNISSTRTPLYRHHEDKDVPKFADYILTTPDVKILDFKVLPDIVSDHAPLYLEFSF